MLSRQLTILRFSSNFIHILKMYLTIYENKVYLSSVFLLKLQQYTTFSFILDFISHFCMSKLWITSIFSFFEKVQKQNYSMPHWKRETSILSFLHLYFIFLIIFFKLTEKMSLTAQIRYIIPVFIMKKKI